MKNIIKRSLVLLFTLALLFSANAQLSGCSDLSLRQRATQTSETGQNETEYSLINIPISRNGVELHLDCMTVKDSSPQKNILLTHGVGWILPVSVSREPSATAFYPIPITRRRIFTPLCRRLWRKAVRTRLICWAGAGER